MKTLSNFKILTSLLFITFSGYSQELDNIESIEYDSLNSRYLISNSNSILAQDTNGVLTFFGDGAKAEYGMEIMDGNLYAIVGNTIMVYGLDDGSEQATISIPGAQFLNGLAHDNDLNLYATDFSGGKIFKIDVSDLENPTVTEFVSNTNSQPNGIVYDPSNNRLVFVNWDNNGPINAVSLENSEVTELASTSLSRCDGITRDPEGNFYVACWSPQSLTQFDEMFTQPGTLLEPEQEVNNPADITFNPDTYEVAVPNSGDGTLSFAQIEKPLNVISGNQIHPAQRISINNHNIYFDLVKDQNVSVNLYETSGKWVREVVNEKIEKGSHHLSLSRNLSQGQIFLVKVKINDYFETLKLVP